tara:strand:+ start:349 stop:573 length:225 start_codon:yes stop_codon:yes gene_type:complete
MKFVKKNYDLFSDDVLTRDQLQKRLSLSKSSMYNFYRQGLPFMQVGGTRYTSKKDFNDFFASQNTHDKYIYGDK